MANSDSHELFKSDWLKNLDLLGKFSAIKLMHEEKNHG